MEIKLGTQTDNTQETALVSDAVNGSAESFCELYGMYKDKLYRYALYKLGDPTMAEDAVSECVLAAWKDIGKLRSGAAFGAWIFRILHNICAAEVRKAIAGRNTVERIGTEQAHHSFASPVTSIELREALAQISEEDKEIVLLSVISDMTSKEISEITGMPPGTVRSRLSRSLAKMRVYLQ